MGGRLQTANRIAAEFGRFLREQRERVSLSLEQVDARSEGFGHRVTKSYLSRCELGEQLPDLQRLQTLASLYGLSIEEFASQFETCLLLSRGRKDSSRAGLRTYADLITEGKKAAREGRYSDSLACFRRARTLIDEQPEEAEAKRTVQIGIAFALAALGKGEQAGRMAMELISSADDDADVKGNSIILLANSLNMRSLSSTAVAVLAGFGGFLKKCNPSIRGRAKLALSNAHRALDNHAEAEHAARRALVEFKYCGKNLPDSERAVAHYLLAQALEGSGKRDPALSELKRARTLWAKDQGHIKIAQAHIASGEIYLTACNYPAARRHLTRAARLARDYASQETMLASYVHLWQLESALGNGSRAASYLRLARRILRSLPKDIPSIVHYTELLAGTDSSS